MLSFQPSSVTKYQDTHLHFLSLHLPVNCWPQENGAGSCDVNIEYNLENTDLELSEVVITIPLAPGAPPPVINECEGEHEYNRAHCALVWRIPVIDKTAPTAAMDFTARGVPDNFFPVRVSFNSTRTFCDIKVCVCTQLFLP